MAGSNVYSPLKTFHYADRLRDIAHGRICAPVHVRIKPINRCNHNCWYCAYRVDHMALGADMVETDTIPEIKIYEIVDDLITMDVKAVTFSGGGEPLLYKPLPNVIDRLGAANIKIGCLTNGANLKGRFADALANHGTWVRISIDAWDDASYTESRGAKPGAFSQLMDNLKAFNERKSKCAVGVSLIIGKNNHTHIFDVCRQLKKVGTRHVKLSAAVVSNNVGENNAYHEPLLRAVEDQIQQTQSLQDGDFDVVNHFHTLSERFEKPYATCPSIKFMTIIGADQRVYSCQDKAYTAAGLLGSLEHQSFRTFWQAAETRAQLDRINPMSDCQHHCVSHAKNMVLWDYLNLAEEHMAFI